MKEVIPGHKYLLNNKPSGRQSIKFAKLAELPDEADQAGTTEYEVLAVLIAKIEWKFKNNVVHWADKESEKNFLKVLKEHYNNRNNNEYS